MASPNGADAGARYRDRSRLEVADQPGAGASGAGGRTRPGRIDHLRRAAQPRHRTDAGRAADPGPARRRCGFGTDGQRPNRTGAGARVDCGLAGTVLRFVPPLAALGSVPVTFDGDQQARGRPIAPLLDALRELGVAVDGTGLPFRVRGNGSLAGGTVAIDASASSQFVSGLLLSAASFTDGLTVQHTGSSLPSAPHIAMTAAMLRQAGVDIDDSTPNRWQVRPGPVAARRWDIEPDLTNAVAFLSAAVVSGGTVRITGWPRVSVQPADHILAILRQLNAVVIHADSSLEVRGPTGYDGFDVDLRAVGELTPSVARWRRWHPRDRCPD